MRVAVVTVGDEILAGDITDTNSAWLAERLTERGVDVARMRTLPDDPAIIAAEVAELAAEFDAVLVAGGLGPTHDDVTMAGVARAFDRDLVEHADAVAWFDDHANYVRADLAAGTTHLPEGARLLPNEVGVAPGAVVENVYVFPGVPAELRGMFEAVADEFAGTPRHVEFVYAAEPESALIDRFAAVRERFGVTVGSYPGENVRVKLQHPDPDVAREAAAWLRDRVDVPERQPDYR